MIRRRLKAVALGVALLTVSAPVLAANAPDFKLRDLEGKTVRLSSYRGKSPVVLAFGATWCPYCRRQIPNLIVMRKEFRPEDLAMFAVDIQESRAEVLEFYRTNKVNYPVLIDSRSRASEAYGVSGIPYVVLISRDGNIIATDYGVTKRLVEKIRSIIPPPSSEPKS